MLIITLGIVALITLALYSQNLRDTSLALQGNTLHLKTTNAFWYSRYILTETLQTGDYEHAIYGYIVPCSRIKIHEYERYFESRTLYLTYPTRMMGVMDYMYLLPGSTISYNICLWTNTSVNSAEFFVFDSLSNYRNFIDEDTDGQSSVAHYTLTVGTPNSHGCTEVQFIAQKAAYYFMSARCDGGVNYQYNISSNVKFLNHTDYTEQCVVTGFETCDISIGGSFLSSPKEWCLIAHVTSPPPYIQEPQTTHITFDTEKRYEVLIIPVTVIAIGLLGLLGHVILLFYCNYGRGKFHRYTAIN